MQSEIFQALLLIIVMITAYRYENPKFNIKILWKRFS